MDPLHPYLIGDCLIHIYTFLTEEDLIIASRVCKVSVQHAEVVEITVFVVVDIILTCSLWVSRIGTKLRTLRGYGGELFSSLSHSSVCTT